MRYLALVPLFFLSSAPAQPTPDGYVVRLGLAHDETSPVGAGAFEFTQLVNEQLEGRVRIELVTQAQDVLRSLQAGELQMGVIATTELVATHPQMVLFDLPFFFVDLTAVTEIENSYIGESLLASLENTGILGLAYWTFGMNRLFSNKQLTSPNEFQNITLWTNNSPLAHPAVSNLGLHPVSFPSERLFENVPSDIAFDAMETGEIGAADLSPLVVAQAPEEHVFKTFLDVGYRPLVTVLAANVSFWDELPHDLQTQLIALVRKIHGTVDYLAAEADQLAVSDLTNAQYTQLSLSLS